MSDLFVALALAAAVVVLLLAFRLSLAVQVERTDRSRVAWRFEWLGGLVRLRGSAPGRRARAARPKPAKRAKRRTAGRSVRRGFAIANSVLRTRGFLPRVARLGRDLVRQVSVEDFHLRVEYGLEDPADTGRLHGVLAPLLVAASQQGWRVEGRPRFVEAGLQGSFGARLHLRPVALLAVVAGFAFSLPFLRALAAAWRSR